MNNKSIYLGCWLMLFCFDLQAAILNIEGTYQGQNIHIQNPFLVEEKSYCVLEISVNGLITKNFTTAKIEVDLSRLRTGEYVLIRITHRDNCTPKVLNPEVLLSESTFDLISFKADEKSVKWTTNNERTQEPFVLEHYRNNKWVLLSKVVGKGPEGYNNYTVVVSHCSGTNKYRLRQRDKERKWVYSEVLEYYSNKKPVTFYPTRADKVVYLSEKTEYEIYSQYGSLIRKGVGERIIVEDLEPGVYYLNMDNRTEKFLKK